MFMTSPHFVDELEEKKCIKLLNIRVTGHKERLASDEENHTVPNKRSLRTPLYRDLDQTIITTTNVTNTNIPLAPVESSEEPIDDDVRVACSAAVPLLIGRQYGGTGTQYDGTYFRRNISRQYSLKRTEGQKHQRLIPDKQQAELAYCQLEEQLPRRKMAPC